MNSIAIIDPAIKDGFRESLAARLAEGWTVTSDPVGAAIIVTENTDVSPAVVAQAGGSLRLVVRLDPGKAVLDVGAVPTMAIPNIALTGVAEHAVTLILASLRQLMDVTDRTRERRYLPDRSTPILTTQKEYTFNWIGLEDFGVLYRRTVGIVGLGYIGRAVADRLRPFGARILYTQRTPLPAATDAELGVWYRSMDDLLAESDVVTLHHRFQDGPDGNDAQFDARAFARMKRGGIFINTARGRLVDETALAEALESGHLRAAALDVFRHEPLPPDHVFYSIPPSRLLLTPHVAGAPNAEAWRLMSEMIVERAASLA
jgi:phosphoglycerate dehydrogenase-like enzyme